jgi:hypothetical protein
MVTTTFYVPQHRYYELKEFIRLHTPSVRHQHNPIPIKGEEFMMTLCLTVDDLNRLSKLREKWFSEDNELIKKDTKGVINKILNFFKK